MFDRNSKRYVRFSGMSVAQGEIDAATAALIPHAWPQEVRNTY